MARTQSAWGIDVGTASLKAVKLRRVGEKLTVEAFDLVEHEKPLTDPDIDRDEMIRQTLQKFLDRNGPSKDLVSVGVAGASSFARFVKLPPVEPRQIPEIVKFEAVQQIPFPLDQVNWDFKTFQNAGSPDVEVGILAMKTELVGQVLGNFRSVGIRVGAIQLSPLAIYNALSLDNPAGEQAGTLVVDMGAEHTDLIVLDQGRAWLRTINIGGNHFTDVLAKSFKQSFQRAEALKKTAATSKYARQIVQAMRPILADLVTEIQRSIGFYTSNHRDSRLSRVVGLGNPFKLPNLQQHLQQNLQMEVVRFESFDKIGLEERLAAGFSEHILLMPGACGLAIQGLGLASVDTNLLPLEEVRKVVWDRKKPYVAAAAAAMVLGSGFMSWRAYSDRGAFLAASGEQSVAQKNNNSTLDQATGLIRQYRSVSGTYQSDQELIESLMAMRHESAVWPMVLHDIFQVLPQSGSNFTPTDTTQDRHKRKAIFIRSLTSLYQNEIPDAATKGAKTPPGMPGPAAAAGAASGGTRRGFQVTLVGYTPFKNPYPMLNELVQHLKRQALPESEKPYYFEIPDNFLKEVAAITATNGTVWMTPSGVLADAILNPTAKPPEAPGASSGNRSMQILDPNTQESMLKDSSFTLTFKVCLK